jgi:hypothetical protein
MFETWQIDRLTVILTLIILVIPAILFLITNVAIISITFWIAIIIVVLLYLIHKKKQKK